jgi:hypothetical protein
MKRITLLAIFAIAAFSNNANAQTNNTQSTANTNASAKLIKVMSVKNADANGLDFGTIILQHQAKALLKWRQQML